MKLVRMNEAVNDLTMEDFISQNLDNFERTKKRKYSIYAHLDTKPGVKVYNTKEGTSYITSSSKNIVMSGQDGEQWVMDEKSFNKTYEVCNKKLDNGFVEVQTKIGNPCVAVQIPKNLKLEVHNGWGDSMVANRPNSGDHGTGDFLVMDADASGHPIEGTARVVEFATFNRTYDKVKGAKPTHVKSISQVPKPRGFQTDKLTVTSTNESSSFASIYGIMFHYNKIIK